MKNFSLILSIVFTFSLTFLIPEVEIQKPNSLINMITISNAMTENPDDEANKTVTEKCNDGTYCDCVWCVSGSTDCSPTCPCCDE